MYSPLCFNDSDGVLNETCVDEVSCPDPAICNSPTEGNVWLAFGLTIGAGMATTVGALLPFVPFIKRANTYFLTIGLSLAAGVMLFISFTDIWTKSRDNFCCISTAHFDLATTACFFAGILVTFLLDLLVGGLQKLECCYCTLCCCAGKDRNINGDHRSRKVKGVNFFRRKGDHEVVQGTNTLQLEADVLRMASSVSEILISQPSVLGEDVDAHATVVHRDEHKDSNPDTIHGANPSNGHLPMNHEQQFQCTGENSDLQFFDASDKCPVSTSSGTLPKATNNYDVLVGNGILSDTSALEDTFPKMASQSLAEVEEEEENKKGHVRVMMEKEGELGRGGDNPVDQGNVSLK